MMKDLISGEEGRKEGGENDDFVMLYIYRIQPCKSFRVYLSHVFVYVYRSRGQMWVITTISGEFSLGTLRASLTASLFHNFYSAGFKI